MYLIDVKQVKCQYRVAREEKYPEINGEFKVELNQDQIFLF